MSERPDNKGTYGERFDGRELFYLGRHKIKTELIIPNGFKALQDATFLDEWCSGLLENLRYCWGTLAKVKVIPKRKLFDGSFVDLDWWAEFVAKHKEYAGVTNETPVPIRDILMLRLMDLRKQIINARTVQVRQDGTKKVVLDTAKLTSVYEQLNDCAMDLADAEYERNLDLPEVKHAMSKTTLRG